MIVRLQTRPIIAILLILSVYGCSNNAKQASRILNADAGPDVNVKSGEMIILDAGNSSSGGSISYDWTQIDGPANLFEGTLRNRREELTAPNVIAVSTWIVKLSVHDGKNTADDQVQITITPSPNVAGESGPPPGPYSVNVIANPLQGGSAEGTGTFPKNTNIIVKATPKTGYGFVNWTEGDAVVSASAIYSLHVTAPHELVANFKLKGEGPQLNLQNGDGQVTLSWILNPTATSYNVYYAQEQGVAPDNHGALTGGAALIDVDSPLAVPGLVNGKDYFFVVTSLASNVESFPSRQLGAQPRSLQPKFPKLNDTGITNCANDISNSLTCPQVGYSNQDGDYGRDANARAKTLLKIGAGSAGFDFTKIGADGKDLSNEATIWNCVRDNVTGLWWEVKTNDGGLHDKDSQQLWSEVHTGFVADVNKQSLCGFSDWRLPTLDELYTIVDFSISSPGPTIDTNFFPNTVNSGYLSSTPGINFILTDYVWYVNFKYGHDGILGKTSGWYVRLVRAGQ